MKDLAVIIVSYNVRELLDACLASVHANGGVTFDVCVVDNASGDGSADMVAAKHPQTSLIRNPRNAGYAAANNQAMAAVGAADWSSAGQPRYRYVLLLNPDTRLGENDLQQAVSFMDSRPDVGVLGPKLVRSDGSMDLACRRSFPTPSVALYRLIGLSRLFPRSRRFGRYNVTYLDPDATAEVDAVAGAFMLVRAETVRRAGPLDERFFMYGEDLDWALRMKSLGWKVVYYPELTVLHYKGESARRGRRRAMFEFYRSMFLFYRKHYASRMFFLLDWLIVAGIILRGAVALVSDLLSPKVPAVLGTMGRRGSPRPRS